MKSSIPNKGAARPTVISPKEYKARFREAMGRYFAQVPSRFTSTLDDKRAGSGGSRVLVAPWEESRVGRKSI